MDKENTEYSEYIILSFLFPNLFAISMSVQWTNVTLMKKIIIMINHG